MMLMMRRILCRLNQDYRRRCALSFRRLAAESDPCYVIAKGMPRNSQPFLLWNSSENFRTRRCYSSSISMKHRCFSKCRATESAADDNVDAYQKYRRLPPSPPILAELQLEALLTRKRIQPEIWTKAQNEIQKAWGRIPLPSAELGPTGTWWYGFVWDKSHRRRRYQRQNWHVGQDDAEEITQTVLELDPAEEVLSLSLSVDETCIACLVENAMTGRRQVILRHIETERSISLEMISVVGLEWGPSLEADMHSLYFVGADEKQGRPDRILVSKVNTTVLHVDEPELILQSNDPSEIVDVQRAKGCTHVSINILTKTSNEIYLSDGPSELHLVAARQDEVQYHLDVGEHGDVVMLISNRGQDYRLYETSTKSLPLDMKNVLDEIGGASRNSVAINEMDVFRDHLVLYETSTITGYPQITIQDRAGLETTSHSVTVPMGPPHLKLSPAGNTCFGSTSLRLLVENPATPPVMHELDFSSLELTPVAADDASIGTIKDGVQHERVFVKSSDGTRIPMTIIWRADSQIEDIESSSTFISSWWDWCNGRSSGFPDKGTINNNIHMNRPSVLIGYGAYGENVNMGYDPVLASLLEEGFVLAFAHTRGGGELGKQWYHQAIKMNKPKVVQDFIACAEYLKKHFRGPVTAKGFSAAGIMMGAAVNQRPDLFDNLILTNPFLDLHATMARPDLYLTAHEWDEFGNPRQNDQIDSVIRSYCPFLNVASNTDEYPQCLLIGVLDDDRVPYWNVTIFAKKIQAQKSNVDDSVSLHIQETGGHHLGEHRLSISALELAFLLQHSGR